MRFTGFWETTTDDGANEVVTVSKSSTDELLARLRVRLEEVQPGALVKIELIAWGGA